MPIKIKPPTKKPVCPARRPENERINVLRTRSIGFIRPFNSYPVFPKRVKVGLRA